LAFEGWTCVWKWRLDGCVENDLKGRNTRKRAFQLGRADFEWKGWLVSQACSAPFLFTTYIGNKQNLDRMNLMAHNIRLAASLFSF
jgi:hypothetical protein